MIFLCHILYLYCKMKDQNQQQTEYKYLLINRYTVLHVIRNRTGLVHEFHYWTMELNIVWSLTLHIDSKHVSFLFCVLRSPHYMDAQTQLFYASCLFMFRAIYFWSFNQISNFMLELLILNNKNLSDCIVYELYKDSALIVYLSIHTSN